MRRAIVDVANAQNAPVIIQLSVKTIRLWGADPIGKWIADLARSSAVPVALHLDHCTDLDVIQRCIDAGWKSVMFDGSGLPFEKNIRQSKKVSARTQSADVGLEAEIGAIGGVEDDKIVSNAKPYLQTMMNVFFFCKTMPDLAAFAPAIGTAHGFYKGSPQIVYELLHKITQAIDIPIALHGGTGLSNEQFHRCIPHGCAKVNISTMHKQQFIDGFLGIAETKERATEPIPYIAEQYDLMHKGVEQMIKIFGSSNQAGLPK